MSPYRIPGKTLGTISESMGQDLEYLEDNLEILKPSLQLVKIQESLPKDLDLESIEKIQNNYFPPWRASLPYNVEIGSLDKEGERLLHLQELRESNGKSKLIYYTDASWSPEARGIGIAFQYYDQTTHHSHGKYLNIGPSNTVYDGELEAIIVKEHSKD
ncbi:hypothetical protein K3495_g16641 [Podosphaera aphanis]|nr:hypothetical protein K3495_g16641 [Podosphaera aphanis]